MQIFNKICSDLWVPRKGEKWIGSVTRLIYLGLEIDSVNQIVRVPIEKVKKARDSLIMLKNAKKIDKTERLAICCCST